MLARNELAMEKSSDRTGDYPRAYRTSYHWALFGGAVGLAMAFGGIAELVRLEMGLAKILHPLALSIACVGDVLLGSYIIVSLIKFRVILYENRIELVGALWTRTLLRDEIGAKLSYYGGCLTYSLIPRSKRQRRLQISMIFSPDRQFQEWIDSIPNADRTFLRNRRQGV